MEECSPRAINEQAKLWIDANAGLVRLILRGHLRIFFNTTNQRLLPTFDDCDGVAYLAAIKAFEGYDEHRGNFNSYYKMVLWSVICEWFKNDSQVVRNRYRNYTHSKSMRHTGREPKLVGTNMVSCDFLSSQPDIVETDKRLVADQLYSNDFKMLFDTISEPLDGRDKEIMWLRYGVGLQLTDIGARLGKSKQLIHQIVNRSLKLMRQHSMAKRLALAFDIIEASDQT